MATYDYLKSQNGHKIQVESAKRDGAGKNIENNYAKQNGYYKQLTSGLAENLTPYGENSGAYGDTPFVFQTSGGASDVGEKAYIRALRGNSVALNQLLVNGNFADSSNWILYSGTGTLSIANNKVSITCNGSGKPYFYSNTKYSLVSGHKYLITVDVMFSAGGMFRLDTNGLIAESLYTTVNSNIRTKCSFIGTGTSNTNREFWLYPNDAESYVNNATITYENFQLFDLTLMFGAGNEPTSVLEFNRLFPKPYYEYNVGTLLSSKSNGYKIVGYNAWDEQWEQGYIDNSGINQAGSWAIRSKNFIPVIAGQTYTMPYYLKTLYSTLADSSHSFRVFEYDANYNFISANAMYGNSNDQYWSMTLNENTRYIKFYTNFETTYNNDICIHLTWDGSKTGYEPYESTTYPLPDVELRSAGSVYDELKPDGTLIRRVGTQAKPVNQWLWSLNSSYNVFEIDLSGDIKQATGWNVLANILCNKYIKATANEIAAGSVDKAIAITPTGYIWIRDTAYNDATTFKNSLSSTDKIYYELATPTTEQTSNTFQELTDIDDFGTQEFLSSASIVIPQGNEFFYPVDYKAFIDSLGGRADIEYDASEVVSHTELSASETQRDTIDGQLKEALGGTLRQVLSVKESIDFNNTAWVDLSTITWLADHSTHRFLSYGFSAAEGVDASLVGKLVCSHFQTVTVNSITVNSTLGIGISSNGTISVSDTGRTSMTADEFKAAMKNVLLAYKKA